MEEERDITVSDLNKALKRISEEAIRKNKALGLSTLYIKEGYLVKLDPSGREHKLKKVETKKKKASPKVISFNQ